MMCSGAAGLPQTYGALVETTLARSSPSIDGHDSTADRTASVGIVPAPMTPRMTPWDLKWRVSCRVSISLKTGIWAASSQSTSEPVARQFEYVGESSLTTTPATWGVELADSGSSKFTPWLPICGAVITTICPEYEGSL